MCSIDVVASVCSLEPSLLDDGGGRGRDLVHSPHGPLLESDGQGFSVVVCEVLPQWTWSGWDPGGKSLESTRHW